MIGALKLGLAAGLAYQFGGQLGERGLALVSPTASQSTMTAAQWGGRVTTFLVAAAILAKV